MPGSEEPGDAGKIRLRRKAEPVGPVLPVWLSPASDEDMLKFH
jgi:hypothetical protein